MLKVASLLAVTAAVPKLLDTRWYTGFAAGTLIYMLTGGWKNAKILWYTFPRDFMLIWNIICVELFIKKMDKKKMVVADYLTLHAKNTPDKIAYQSADTNEKLTYKEANELANKVANYFYELGYRKGDVVALVMENRVEYLPIWLGLSKLGVITALINTNLRGDSLQHCIDIAGCKSVIYSKMFHEAIDAINTTKVEVFSWEEVNENIKSLVNLLKTSSTTEPFRQEISVLDKMIYIYTSGTTGLPKPAIIRGSRFGFMGIGIAYLSGIQADDILYNTLPLYHSNGGCGMAGACLFMGCTLISKQKFSASKFFEDCCKYDCTIFNYIGETCRYLLAQPSRDSDKQHKIRFCTGNGLRGSIWKEFQSRFNLSAVKEFYGATEGNASMMNCTGYPGAVGYMPPFLTFAIPTKIIRVDKETGEIIRGPDGLAIDSKPGEPGELVSMIKNQATKQFDGYVNKEATKKKIAYDIFSKGDSAFISGDIFTRDEYGYHYFQDRTGDTFRWKGENVSTNEVEGVISKSVKLNDVCVYGVEVNGIEGKAGMACIVDPQRHLNIDELYSEISKTLPPYARPVFIRLSDEIAQTGTHKFQKTSLRKESFNPKECGNDHLFYFDGKQKKYLPLDENIYDEILNQKVKF